MADYYTELSFIVPLTEEQQEWGLSLIKCVDEVCAGDSREGLASLGFDQETIEKAFCVVGEEWGLGIAAQEDNKGLWVCGDGSPNLELLASLIQEILIKFNITEPFGFEWGCTANKPRLDAFGGGAVVITRDDQQWMNTGGWLQQALSEARGNVTQEAATQMVSDYFEGDQTDGEQND